MSRQTHQNASSAPTDLGEVVEEFNTAIESFIESRALPVNLRDATVYSVLGGGKRLRPALAWYSSVACGGTGLDARWGGIAVELVHAFSLIHDDLPAIDDDDYRRGRAALHVHTSEAMAILAGDALLSMAYEAALAHPEPGVSIRLARELGEGTRGMIIGQVYDTLGGLREDLSDEEKLGLIHRNKTGTLLAAACRMGAICASADEQMLGLITDYAGAIGLQFQIIDDLLDVEGAVEKIGKATGKDAAAGKLTYPGVMGTERSREIARELGDSAQRSLDALAEITPGSVEPLGKLGRTLTHRTF